MLSFFAMMNTKFNFLRFLIFTTLFCNFIIYCATDNTVVKKSVNADDNRDDNGETNDESKDESLDIPVEQNENPVSTPNNISCTRRQNSKIREIRNAVSKQFPFMAAILSHQNEYLCSGTVVSNGLILTTARCTTLPVNYVLLNVTTAKKDDTVVVLRIMKTEKFPTYSNDYDKDVGLIYTDKHNRSIASKITLSNFNSTEGVMDFEALGFGLNTELGAPKVLQYFALEHRPDVVDYLDRKHILKGYFDCVNSKEVACFKDVGGPAISNNELVGIVIKGQSECTKETTANFYLNKVYAEVLPTFIFKSWLEEKIQRNEAPGAGGPVSLVSYPAAPVNYPDIQMNIPETRRSYSPPIRTRKNAGAKVVISFLPELFYVAMKILI